MAVKALEPGDHEPGGTARNFDAARARADFPILATRVHGKPLVYLDNAATTQKPQSVIDAICRYYTSENANVHRGVHYLSEIASEKYERTRQRVADFLGATVECEILFTRGTTESLNLVAQSYAAERLGEDDMILITHLEHHSNLVPWQVVCAQTGARLRVVPIDDAGNLIMSEFDRLLDKRVKIVSVSHVSNALGTLNPIKEIAAKAHAQGAVVVVDGAQSASHLPIDVADLGCDFYACSGHKMYGPTGVGVLYGRAEFLDAMSPYQTGGNMILSVRFEGTTYGRLPQKFEAGTPHIEGVIGLSAALDYLDAAGMGNIAASEKALLDYATRAVKEVPGLRLIGEARERAGVLSFVMDSAHPHDIGQILDDEGVAVRAGHHCAQPVMERFQVPATARASLGLYNTREDIDTLVRGLHRVNEVFA